MFISEAAALSIVREMKEITGHDINIMDGTGTIFASTDPGRVGQRHEGACQILSQKLPRLTAQEDRRPGGAEHTQQFGDTLHETTSFRMSVTAAPAGCGGWRRR